MQDADLRDWGNCQLTPEASMSFHQSSLGRITDLLHPRPLKKKVVKKSVALINGESCQLISAITIGIAIINATMSKKQVNPKRPLTSLSN